MSGTETAPRYSPSSSRTGALRICLSRSNCGVGHADRTRVRGRCHLWVPDSVDVQAYIQAVWSAAGWLGYVARRIQAGNLAWTIFSS